MFLLFIAALFSVAVSLLLKWSKPKGFSPLALVTWNYAAALVLSWFLLKPDLAVLHDYKTVPWFAFVGLGVLLPSVFMALAVSLQRAGLIKTEVAQRMSVLLSLLAAFFLFHEPFNWFKTIAIGVGILAVMGLVANSSAQKSGKSAVGFSRGGVGVGGMLLLVWLGYAAVDVLLKYISTLGYSTSTALFCSFGIAFIGLLIIQVFSRPTFKRLLHAKQLLLGLLLGVMNFCNIWFYIRAHQQLADNPAIVFTSMNILVVLLGVVMGVLVFREKLKASAWFFVLLSILSIVILYYARLS